MAVETIVVGRTRDTLKDFGAQGTAFIGKHIVGEGDDSHLTNAVRMDVAWPHIVLICGKRGTGKSFSGGVIAEEIASLPPEVRQNLSILLFDTMGIYWSMKQANNRDAALLREWGIKPHGLPIQLVVPKAFQESYDEIGVKVDANLVLPAGDLTALDWTLAFGFSPIDDFGIAIERAVASCQKRYNKTYNVQDLLLATQGDQKTSQTIKDALANRFLTAHDWDIFAREGLSTQSLFQPGVVTVVDVSHFQSASQGFSVKSLLIGLLSRKIYQDRLIARKAEEFEVMTGEKKQTIPLAWILIDEAHEFLPSEGATAASEPLHTLIKQGREPGISLILITQRPNRLHEDALAQADLVIAHRLTSKGDLDALRGIMQNYLQSDIEEYINALPHTKGAAIVLDDNSERIYTIQVRPRFTWHAGGSPSALKKKGIFEE